MTFVPDHSSYERVRDHPHANVFYPCDDDDVFAAPELVYLPFKFPSLVVVEVLCMKFYVYKIYVCKPMLFLIDLSLRYPGRLVYTETKSPFVTSSPMCHV